MTQAKDSRAAVYARIVGDEAFLWGDRVAQSYHELATHQMDQQWSGLIQPVLARHNIDYTVTMDFACGRGRNTTKLSPLSKKMILVDVNPENIAIVRQRFSPETHRFVLNSGYDVNEIESESVTFIYSFDAVVHFDLEIILQYIKEFHRVLKPGGHGFIHHSNFTGAPGADFRDNQHWRNFMSKGLFAHLCIRNKLKIAEQVVIPWGSGARDLDCLTVFVKPD